MQPEVLVGICCEVRCLLTLLFVGRLNQFSVCMCVYVYNALWHTLVSVISRGGLKKKKCLLSSCNLRSPGSSCWSDWGSSSTNDVLVKQTPWSTSGGSGGVWSSGIAVLSQLHWDQLVSPGYTLHLGRALLGDLCWGHELR